MNWIDTHTHLYLEQFKDDIDDVLKRCKESGVNKLCLPAIDKSTHQAMLDLAANKTIDVHPMIGLHPCSVKDNFEEELSFIESELNTNNDYIAIGEIGLDLYWDTTFKEQQIVALKRQIELAKEYSLPIVIHVRNAFNEIFEVLDKVNDDKLFGVFHCFTGGKRHAKKAIDLGFKLGLGGVLTFDQGLPNVIKKIDVKHLVLETDSPFLAPVPHKGKQNESSYVVHVAEKLAEIKNMSLEEISKITTANAQQLFSI